MSRGTVLVTDPIGGDASIISAVLAENDLSTITPTSGQHWHQLAAEADGAIVNLVAISMDAFAHLRRCHVIARLGVGVDNVDLRAARERGVVITNVPEYCREEVSDHALALMLALIRKIPSANADIAEGRWDQLRYRPIRRLSTMVLGLIGYGRLAQAFAKKAASLGMRVIASDPYARTDSGQPVTLVDLSTLFSQADVVSLHVPLTNETRGMIDATALAKMKPRAFLINTSRGELVDESALAVALDDGQLGGAGLDVVAREPLDASSPLRRRHNVLLTPHMAFYSEDSLIELQRTAAEDVARVLNGQSPRHRVD